MSTAYHYIIDKTKAGKKLFAVLIDPEKCVGERLTQLIQKTDKAQPDFILVGGSQLTKSVEQTVIAIKALTNIPVSAFPGQCDANIQPMRCHSFAVAAVGEKQRIHYRSAH